MIQKFNLETRSYSLSIFFFFYTMKILVFNNRKDLIVF